MSYIDLHCDTLQVFAGKGGSLYENRMSVDIRRLLKGGCKAQFFAVWLPDQETKEGLLTGASLSCGPEAGAEPVPELFGEKTPEEWDDCYIKLLTDGFYRELSVHGNEISFAGSLSDLRKNEAEGKLSAFLSLEDGRAVRGDLSRIDGLYDRGFRLITLTWNFDNCFGRANYRDGIPGTRGRGLTDFGREAVAYMNDRGMAVDVSHLSDEGFYEVAEAAKKPFLASHSNARALADCSRNLSDDMLRLLGERGGITGLNFAPGFLSADFYSRESRIEDMVRHAVYLVKTGGEEVLALGTDFDGIGGSLEIGSAEKIPLLWDALKKGGFTERQIELFQYKNAERFIGDTMG